MSLSLPKASYIEEWKYNGESPIKNNTTIYDLAVNEIVDDTTPILFRTLNLKNKKDEKDVFIKAKAYQEKETTSFLPAPIHKLTRQQLVDKMKPLGLPTHGSKAELAERLSKFFNH